jgi:chromosome segregation ATPase
MKLNELAVISPTKQAAKVFESYFGNSIKFDQMTQAQARSMLKRVRNLIAEHRRTPGFHSSEQNPSYLKLVVMEQALATQAVAPQATAQQQAGMQAAQIQQGRRQIQDAIKQKQKELTDLQKQLSNPTLAPMAAESKIARRLREASEIQQAQVVLASQDMVDQVQKMSEQVSAMQFKDLPALVDQIKNEVGVDQATQFNGDASAALSGLLQNLQGAKQQLEAALGVVTGQAPQVPGADMGADLSAPAPDEEVDVDAELPTPDGEENIDAEFDSNLETPKSSLGRSRR